MSTDYVPTKASLLKKQPQNNYQEVTFKAHKPKKKKETLEKLNEQKENSKEEKFDIRKAKHEIIKFGISGFDPLKKEEAKIQQLIKLGAKPPKNKYKNYKQLLNERKRENEKQASEEKFQQLGKNSVGKSTAKGKSFDRKRKKKGGILDIYGKIIRDKSEVEIKKK